MTKQTISQSRLNRFHQVQARMGEAQFKEAIESHRAPAQLRMLTWGFSKMVNVAIAVARVFQTPTRGDLSLLGFELLALGYFMPVKAVIEFDREVVRLSEELSSIVKEMSRAGLIDQPDENHPLVAEYVHVVTEAEALVQRVHVAYRQHVSFKGVLG